MMKKILLSLLWGLMLVFALGASCSKNSTPNTVVTSTVTIQNSAFNPATITIARGGVITWKNLDSTTHQIITDGNLPELESGQIDQNGTFSFTFNNTGTYDYHCNIHPIMKGEIIVK